MTFHEIQFPPDIAYGATGGPEYATTVVAMASGFEQRNANWSAARLKWNVASGLKHQAQLNTLIAFFRARKGRAYGFRFKDWTDYRASAQTLGAGDEGLFSLSKPTVSATPVALTLDATFFGRGCGLMIYRAEGRNSHFLRGSMSLPSGTYQTFCFASHRAPSFLASSFSA